MAKLDQTAIKQKVIKQVLDAIEKDQTLPWTKPWTMLGGSAYNWATGKYYRGINVWVLTAIASSRGYEANQWLTYKQAKAKGGSVRKGEKGTSVVFWKVIRKDDTDAETGEEKTFSFPILRMYTVFNIDQIDGLEAHPVEAKLSDLEPHEKANKIMQDWQDCPDILVWGDVACYSPLDDKITMPKIKQFKTHEGYYGTLFHEGVHATGHSKRLGRDTLTQLAAFGSPVYSREELVAELGASMLCGIAGIEPDYNNTTAYLKGWIKKLRNDPEALFWAGQQAQKAVDHITGYKYKSETA